MLLVDARVGPSSIHGCGLIARQFISAGTLVWRFVPGFDVVLTESQLAALSLSAREQVLHYAEWRQDRHVFVLSADDDRFTNHSENPNTRSEGDVVYATQDIHPGEEITCDYRQVVVLAFRPGAGT